MYSGMYLGINPAIHDFGLGSRVWGINSCGLKLRIYCTVQDLFGKVKTFSKKRLKRPGHTISEPTMRSKLLWESADLGLDTVGWLVSCSTRKISISNSKPIAAKAAHSEP